MAAELGALAAAAAAAARSDSSLPEHTGLLVLLSVMLVLLAGALASSGLSAADRRSCQERPLFGRGDSSSSSEGLPSNRGAGPAAGRRSSTSGSREDWYIPAMSAWYYSSAITATRPAPMPKLSMQENRQQPQRLCPDLLVPPKWECILLVPSRPLSRGSFDILDPSGRVVLTAAPRPVAWGRLAMAMMLGKSAETAMDAKLTRFWLTKVGGQVVAKGCREGMQDDEPEFHILHSSGAFHAQLFHEGGIYVVQTVTRDRLHLTGSFEQHRVTVTTPTGKLVATTEPCEPGRCLCGEVQRMQEEPEPCAKCGRSAAKPGSHYRLRVGPGEDVALLLSALLCVDNLT